MGNQEAEKKLIIVESPTKARTLTRFLGNKYQIEATMGHIRDLPQKKLGVNINDNFTPEYAIPKDKKKTVEYLKSLVADGFANVILATDPDREGEAIAYHVRHVLSSRGKQQKATFSRIVFHEITKTAIEAALNHPREVDINLVDAQQGRRVLDRLVGYKLSPVLWYKTGKNWLSAGRVQSVAVRLIVEREREIEKFVPEEYWDIKVKLKKAEKELIADLIKIDDKKVEIHDKETADTVVAALKTATYTVLHVQTDKQSKAPPPPFITSTLQRAAANLFGWPARKTMTVAQNLYEEGLITYHRTDSVQLSTEAIDMVRAYINKTYGTTYLSSEARIYKTKSKVAQEAHEAIRPTALTIDPAKVGQNGLGRDHDKLLELITKRFIACQMNDQVTERTTVDIRGGERYLLQAKGEKELFDGWGILYKAKSANVTLPPLTIGDVLDLINILSEQKFTQPPARFNEASLIKILEEQGIGRPSTYAPIISTIQARQYVEKIDSRSFKPTELGIAVNDFLVEHFGTIINVAFTAGMEDKLDNIANGEISWREVIRDFWTPFEATLLDARKKVIKIEVPLEKTGEKCPLDGGELVVRIGRFGKFLACNNFPNCKFTKPIVTKIDVVCPKCGGDVVLKKTRKGRKFFGCSNYPKCDFASWKNPKTTVDASLAKSPPPSS